MFKITKHFCFLLISFSFLFFPFTVFCQTRENEVRIGIHGPFSGTVAYYGELMRKGFLLAVEEINNAGGIKIGDRKLKITTFVEDDRGTPSEGIALTERFITRDKVHAICGPFNSTVALACAHITDQQNIVRVVTIAVADAITQGHPSIFRNYPNQTMQTVQSAEWVMKQGKWKKFGLLLENTDYGRPGGDLWARTITEKGGTVLAKEYFNLGDTDFTTQLTKIKGKDPDAIFVIGLITEGSQIFRQAQKLGIKKQFFGLAGFASEKFAQLAGDSIEGLIHNSYWEPNPKIPKSITFKENFEKWAKMEAEMYSAGSYDGVYILKEAFERANVIGTDKESREALRKAMHKTDYDGVMGRVTFDSNGQTILHVYVVRVEGGKRRIIGP